jgi:hypothetical protein
VPQLIKVHEIVKEFIEKIVIVKLREEVIVEVPVEYEKIVQVLSNNVQVQKIEVIKEKTI